MLCKELIWYWSVSNSYIKRFKANIFTDGNTASMNKLLDMDLRPVVRATAADGGLTTLRQIFTSFIFKSL